MKLFQPRIYFTLLVIILTVSPNACIVEQAIAKIANVVSDGHHTDDAHDQDKTTPSHKHDEDKKENQFCCDNNINFYIISKILTQLDKPAQYVSLSAETVDFDEQQSYFRYDYSRHHFRQPSTLRTRDKYALNCLLHAPPYV
ncbi:MAG: hypothetical protein ACE5HX_05615 [bacterium]